MERGAPKPSFEETNGFMSPAFFDNPYPYYHKLRDHDPVYWSKKTKAWLVTDYETVSTGLRDKRLSVKRVKSNIEGLPPEAQRELTPLTSFYSEWMMYMDPPQHTRIRRTVSTALSPKMAEGMKDGINDTISNQLDKLRDRKSFDVIEDYAKPISLKVMADLFNIPPDDYAKIEGWSTQIVGFLGVNDTDPNRAFATQQAYFELVDFLQPLFEQRRANPQEDIISQLMVANEADRTIEGTEMTAVCANILVDGHEPMTNVIASGVLAFINDPSQRDLLAQDSALIDAAVDEVLRYEPPFQYSGRRATEDMVIGDKQVKKGQKVQFMLGAANRDPQVFDDPDTFNILRSPNKFTSFGFGSHYCIGAPIGRNVIAPALSRLLDEFPDLSLAPQQLEWHKSLGYRGLKSLKVEAR